MTPLQKWICTAKRAKSAKKIPAALCRVLREGTESKQAAEMAACFSFVVRIEYCNLSLRYNPDQPFVFPS